MKEKPSETIAEMSQPVRVCRFEDSLFSDTDDHVAVEHPLAIQLLYRKNGKKERETLSVTMRTPGQDPALAAGYLFTEGIVREAHHIQTISPSLTEADTLCVTLHEHWAPDLTRAARSAYMSSSCGVCGKTSLGAVRTLPGYSCRTALRLHASDLCRFPAVLRDAQETFHSTGGIHASALFTAQGTLLDLAEDVGRHNALDKLIGSAFLAGSTPLSETALLLSGRASFELIQKATMAGIPLVMAIGAPSTGAVTLAQETGITLIGFLRENRFNCYTYPERVIL